MSANLVHISIGSFPIKVNTFRYRQSRYQRKFVYCYLKIGTESPFLID
jgi:hypothetical protein